MSRIYRESTGRPQIRLSKTLKSIRRNRSYDRGRRDLQMLRGGQEYSIRLAVSQERQMIEALEYLRALLDDVNRRRLG